MAGDIGALVCLSCTAGATVLVSEYHPKDHSREIQRNTAHARKVNGRNAGQKKREGKHRDDLFLHKMESTERPQHRHLLEKQFSNSLNVTEFRQQAQKKPQVQRGADNDGYMSDGDERKIQGRQDIERVQENETSSQGPGNFNSLMRRIRKSFILHDTTDKDDAIHQVKMMYDDKKPSKRDKTSNSRRRGKETIASEAKIASDATSYVENAEKSTKSQAFIHRRGSGGWTNRVGDAEIAKQLDFLRDSKQEWEIKHRIGYDPSAPVHSIAKAIQ